MKKIIILALAKILIVSAAFATPNLSSVQRTVTDGEQIVTGAGFGVHPLKIEWTGGSDGNIEKGTAGESFNKVGWTNSTFLSNAKYDRSQAYSGLQSILFDSTSTGDGRFDLSYDIGGSFDLAYATWMARINTGGASGQWKMFRMNWEQNVEDTSPEVVMFNWFGAGGKMFIVRRTPGETEQRYYLASSAYPQNNEWVRIEMILKPSSSPGANNGCVNYIIHRPNISVTNAYSKTDLVTYATSDSKKWRYFVFQNYQGNGLGGYSKVWMDDIYIQRSQARVELGNAERWADCTHREIQVPMEWSDTSIKYKENKGLFKDGDHAFIFVVDANGLINGTGFPIVVGSNGGTQKVSAPTGLRVVNY